MKLLKKAGATSEIWQIFIADSSSTTGAGLTGLLNNSAGLTAYYHRDTDTTATAISLVTMTVGTFTSSGFKEIDATNMPGWYQFCPPNAALASGAKSCGFHLKGATNMAPLPIECQLAAVDPDSATAFITSVATVTTVTNQLTAAQIATGVWQDATAGDFTTASSIGKSLYTSGVVPGGSGGILISGSNSGTTTLAAFTVSGATTLTGAVTASNASNNLNLGTDALTSGVLAASAVTEIVNGVWDEVLTAGTHNVANSSGRRLRQLATLDSSVNDVAATTTSFVTAITTAVDNFYNDQLLAFTSGSLAGQSKPILSYNGTTKAVTLAEALTSAPANGDTFTIQATHIHPISQIASGIWQDTIAGDFTVAASVGKSVMNGVSLGTGLTINGYTGNTPQTGDVYAAVTGVTVEPTSPPASTASILSKILWLFSLGKNKRTQTSTTELVRNDADSATIGTATKSDDGVTFTRGKYS